MFKFNKENQNIINSKSIHANEILSEQQIQKSNSNSKQVSTELSIPKNMYMTEEDRYVYAFHNSQAPLLNINEISIYKIEIARNESNIIVTALIRNTVSKPIHFNETEVALVNENGEPVTYKKFDLSPVGSVPANSAVPWKFTFEINELNNDIESPVENWSLAFVLTPKHVLELDESWEESIAQASKEKLEQVVKSAPPLKPGEINLMGIESRIKENGDLLVTVLFRNGSDKNMQLSQLPLGVEDASREEIARGTFKLDKFSVKSNTSKPWSFIFPKSQLKKTEVNLSKWRVYPIQ